MVVPQQSHHKLQILVLNLQLYMHMYISGGRKRVLERFMYEIVWKRMSFPIKDPVAVSQVGRRRATKVLEKAFSPGVN